jgi:hypothetical protein
MIFDTSNQNEKIIESIKFIKTDEKQTSYQEPQSIVPICLPIYHKDFLIK